MSYLNRDARREVIVLAAMRVALEEGFTAMTVRRIATEAQVSTGQVHHHFTSAGELKSLAFVQLIRTLLDAELVSANASFRERLHAMLGSEDGGFEPYIKLWREAQVLADKDPEIKSAYLLTMRMWHEETAAIITQGQSAGEFSAIPDAAEVAWRSTATPLPEANWARNRPCTDGASRLNSSCSRWREKPPSTAAGNS